MSGWPTPLLQDLPPTGLTMTLLLPHPLWLPIALWKQSESSVSAEGSASSHLPLLIFSPLAVPTSCSRRAWGSMIPSLQYSPPSSPGELLCIPQNTAQPPFIL